MCRNNIIVVIGHSGSGKSTLTKKLGEYFSCDALGFSYAGQILANEDVNSIRFKEISNYIYQCICVSASTSKITLVDGLASAEIVHRLSNEGYSVIILFLDTPYDKRIQRMMIREVCSRQEAINLERIKAEGKSKSGLLTVIQEAEFRLDGSKTIDQITKAAILYIKESLQIE